MVQGEWHMEIALGYISTSMEFRFFPPGYFLTDPPALVFFYNGILFPLSVVFYSHYQ